MEKFDDYRKLKFSSLLKNGNKKFKNKITRSSTFNNRELQNFIKKRLRNKTRKSILKRWRSSMIIENSDFPRY